MDRPLSPTIHDDPALDLSTIHVDDEVAGWIATDLLRVLAIAASLMLVWDWVA